MEIPSAPALLDRLYQLTDAPHHWPSLIDALLGVLASSESAGETPLGLLEEQRLLAWLTPHVLRVLDLHQNQLSNALKEDFFSAFVGQQSIALALCDNQGAVRWMSRQLAEALEPVSATVLERIVKSTADRPSVHGQVVRLSLESLN
jgi:hypothetical protein